MCSLAIECVPLPYATDYMPCAIPGTSHTLPPPFSLSSFFFFPHANILKQNSKDLFLSWKKGAASSGLSRARAGSGKTDRAWCRPQRPDSDWVRYRICSLTVECVLLLQNVFSYWKVCFLRCTALHYIILSQAHYVFFSLFFFLRSTALHYSAAYGHFAAIRSGEHVR